VSEFEGELVTCVDCGRDFVWSAGERDSYERKGHAAPERCEACRRVREDRRGGTGEKGGEE
jgi:hypothetical protein